MKTVSFQCKYATLDGVTFIRLQDVQYGLRLMALQLKDEEAMKAVEAFAREIDIKVNRGPK